MAQALLEYEGSILCISHDRYFIQELATHVWEIYNQRLLTYDGDYEYYLWKKESMRSLFAPELTKPTISVSVPSEPTHPGSLDFRAKKELEKQFRKVEKAILKTEEDIAALEAQLHDPARSQEYPFLQTVSKEIETKQAELSALNDEWTELADKLSE
jgi:ATP-binding cassette subfamily F protein 3